MTATGVPISSDKSFESHAGYDAWTMNYVLDFVNLLTFDFTGPWQTNLGYSTPLFCESEKDDYCIEKALQLWIIKGLCPKKIVVGNL